jgi:hypothetical protein
MAGLIFLSIILFLLILLIRIIVKLFKRKSTTRTLITIGIILFSYSLLWIIFYFKSTEVRVPFGTDVCFDDWCATITKSDTLKTLGKQHPGSQFIVLHIRMSNHARGIAQKPSEPGVYIIDNNGHTWGFSKEGQNALENVIGKQIPIDERLELHQSLETQLVFDIPRNAENLRALIEEGPFITNLLLYGDSEVFFLH